MRGWLWLPVLLGAAMVVGVVSYAMIGRIAYPYDLEWMEGGQLAHGWRVLHGLPLYPEPGPDWIPYIYPPGHATLLAGVSVFFGLSAPIGRALSWLGTALACVSIAWIVIRQNHGSSRWIGGVIGAVCYLACWVPGGTFLDLVRPDAVALGLLMASVALSLERSVALQLLGGVLLAVAFWFKHPLAIFGLPLTVGLWLRDGTPWAALRVGVAALVPAGIAVVVQQIAEPSFLTYLLVVPASHGLVTERILPLTPWELGGAVPVGSVLVGIAALRTVENDAPRSVWITAGVAGLAAIVGVLALLVPRVQGASVPAYGVVAGSAALVLGLGLLGVTAWRLLRGRPLPPALWLGLGLGSTALLLAAWMRGHVGGFTNVHLPLFAMCSVGVGWAVSTCRTPPIIGIVSLALGIQLGVSAWSVPLERLIPTQADVESGDRLVDALTRVEGPVWSPIAPFIPVLAGHAPGPHQIALWDVGNHPAGPWPKTRRHFRQAVKEQHWGGIVEGRGALKFDLEAHYEPGPWVRLSKSFRPRWGWGNTPSRVWVPAPRGGAYEDGEAPGR